MKRGILLVVFLLILVSNIYADINIREITPKIYNLGDKINLNGNILRNARFNGLFKTELVCKQSSVPLITKALDLSANQRYPILEEFTIPNIISGECNLKVILEENNSLLEEKSSKDFEITKELNGNFVLVNSKVQLGKEIEVKGEVFKKNGKKINGVANIHLKKENNIFLIKTEEINEGGFTFIVPANYTNEGSYSIDFDVNDANGNEKVFVDAIKYQVTNLLGLDLKLNKDKINPGDSFEISGNINDIYGNKVRGTFTIKFDGKEYKGNFVFGDFSYSIITNNNIKSGPHQIAVDVYDESGNKGTNNLGINIIQNAEKIDISTDKELYKPGEKINVKSVIYDQGGDVVNRDIKIEIRDSNNGKKIEKITKNDLVYELTSISAPGGWIVRASSADLKNEKKFYISEVKKMSINLEGQTITIVNTGNINFNENINIKLDGNTGGLDIIKKINLDPGESTGIDLGKEAKTGIYKVIANDKIFNNVKIEGTNIGFYKDYSSTVFIVLVFLVLGILLLRKIRLKNSGKNVVKYLDSVKKEIKNKIQEEEREIIKKFKIKPQKSYKDYLQVNLRKDNLNEFRNKSSYLKRREKEKDSEFKEGMFNMFK